VLPGRGLCDELITRPEESYRLWCVVVCDLEASWMRRPWPIGSCCAKRKILLPRSLDVLHFWTDFFSKMMTATGRESPPWQPQWWEKLTQIFKPVGDFFVILYSCNDWHDFPSMYIIRYTVTHNPTVQIFRPLVSAWYRPSSGLLHNCILNDIYDGQSQSSRNCGIAL